jgi:ankyrin repeat protein
MNLDSTKRSYEGTQFDINTLDDDCRNLLKSILNSITAEAWSQVSIPPGTATKDVPWDGRYFWEFVNHIQKDDRKDFEKLLADNGVKLNTLNRIPFQGASKSNSEIAFCTSAEIKKIRLKKYIENYVVRCTRKEYDIEGFKGHDETIINILKKYGFDYTSGDAESIKNISNNIERVEGKEKWLSPCNYDALPLVGRENEIVLLDKFIESDGQFKIWAIAGPSGSGKTRLTFQWAYVSEVLKDWDCHVLHKEDLSTPKKWENWAPDKSTLIIIDYLYGFEKVVLELMSRRSTPTEHKIRLLLIDHVFSEPLHSDKRWGFSGDQESFDRNEHFFYDHKPLDLEETENQEEIIKSIIAERAGIDLESNKIKEAHDYLLNTEGAYRPLFAALVADAINSGKNFKAWNRRELINYYLSGEQRLPWEHEDLGLNGRWASHFIAVATARRGIVYEDLFKAASNCVSTPEHFGDVKRICQKVITNNDTITLKPFKPDILGESFFLKFLKFLENSPHYQKEFWWVFMAGSEGTQTEDAIEFIAFIERLTRNLLNDDQNKKETQELWKTLFDFMRPSDFGDAASIRWALTAGVIDIVDAIKDKNQFSEEKLISWLNQADPAVFYQVHNSSLLQNSVLHSMCWFELSCKLTKARPEFSEEMSILFKQFTENNADGETPLMLASSYGLNEMVSVLLNCGADIEAIISGGQNALMAASLSGHVEVIKLLLAEGANIHATDNMGNNALHWASSAGHVEVVKLLLEKGADIHGADTGGYTALHAASSAGHVEVVKLLLDKGADIHGADDEDSTALHWASDGGHVEVAKLLLDKGANIHATDGGGRTALLVASGRGRINLAKLLLDRGANINVADIAGRTALMWASDTGHINIIKLLLARSANIHATDCFGYTALIWASAVGHAVITDLLLDKGADIHAVGNNGETAFSFATANGHKEIIKLLTEHDTRN